jgi:class 3 adenylate cyclase
VTNESVGRPENRAFIDHWANQVGAVANERCPTGRSANPVSSGAVEYRAHADPDGPWVPIGAGVHSGLVWFGAVGQGAHVELTAIGDAVNVTARLAAAAGAGEILVTSDAATAAGLDPELERRPLELRGKQGATEVVSLGVA